jgi:hypothetical protein
MMSLLSLDAYKANISLDISKFPIQSLTRPPFALMQMAAPSPVLSTIERSAYNVAR